MVYYQSLEEDFTTLAPVSTSAAPTTSGNTAPSKGKSKGIFTALNLSDPESEDEAPPNVHIVTGNSTWINPGSNYKFPCPLQSHDHKIAACSEFLTLTPKDRWFKIPRGRICYTCLKPKGLNAVCKARMFTEEKSVPQVLLCAACTPWATAKGWAAFSILMCRKSEHGKDQAKPADIRKFLEKYLGKISIPDNKLSYTANFNYQVFSVAEVPIPASTCTPTFDSELGIEVDTASIVVSLRYRNTRST